MKITFFLDHIEDGGNKHNTICTVGKNYEKSRKINGK